MKLKNIFSVLCVTSLMAMALAGCGSSSNSTTSAASTPSSSASSNDLSNSEIVGQVQSINDKTVTLLLGELSSADQTQSGTANVPSNQSGDTSAASSADSTQPPAKGQPGGSAPSGTSNSASSSATGSGSGDSSQSAPSGNPPSGGQPNGQPGGGETFTAGTETVSITLSDDTAIKVENASGTTDGTIDDIKQGSILDVTMGENSTVTTVIVKNAMATNTAAPDSTGTSTDSTSSSQSTNS